LIKRLILHVGHTTLRGFRHSLILLLLCSGLAPLSNLTTYTFALDTIPLNAVMIYLSYKFYRHPDEKNSKQLFRFSLLYLPLVMAFAIISKSSAGPTKDKREQEATLIKRSIIPASERSKKRRETV